MSSNIVPVRMSNEDFMQGGLYPGGTGIVRSFRFALWDYDGHMPADSIVAAAMLFQPTDGSNGGKEIMIHWSVGQASDYSVDGPSDGGFVLALKGQQKLGDGSNYAYFYKKLRETCGMPEGRLSQDRGVHALEGSELTLARVDQPKREGLADQQPPQPGQQKRVQQTYIATRAKWGWEMGTQPSQGQAAPATRTAPRGSRAAAQAQPAQTPAPQTQAPPPAASNGAGTVSAASIIESLLLTGPVNVAELPKLGLDWMTANATNLDRSARMPIARELKDPAAVEEMALVNGWKLEGGMLSAQ